MTIKADFLRADQLIDDLKRVERESANWPEFYRVIGNTIRATYKLMCSSVYAESYIQRVCPQLYRMAKAHEAAVNAMHKEAV